MQLSAACLAVKFKTFKLVHIISPKDPRLNDPQKTSLLESIVAKAENADEQHFLLSIISISAFAHSDF